VPIIIRLYFDAPPRISQNIDLPTSVVVDPRGASVVMRQTDTEVPIKQPDLPVDVETYDSSVLVDE
jgi:hypothetical protein